ncbi:MAG: insulinase family protein [Pseudomonadota bacterium]|nr:insulinase family protein [Pseudomonadota bacterium]
MSKEFKDDREYKVIELANGLQVLLMHDPTAKKSAASMDVHVGALADPVAHQGLAHFLEHMLFLGTQKYPTVGEYNKVISKYRGSDNAYTSSEHTNYFFELTHAGFEEVLDRFGQFFIAPLFSQEYVEREMNAVNSEHQRNIKNDRRRIYRLAGLTSRDGHERQKFSTGSLTTLKNVTNKVLVDFYQRHYSANVMKLALLSPLTLAAQEKLVREIFAPIKNKNIAKPTYSPEIYADASLPQRINVVPIADLKELRLTFAVPSTYDYWRTKPTYILSSLIGDEGEGSLLKFLKDKGLALGLSSGTYSMSYAGEFIVNMQLTQQGLDNISEVVQHFFSYVAMLKNKGLERYYFDEQQRLAEIAYEFRDPMEGSDAVVWHAESMHRHPPLDALKNEMLIPSYSQEDFNTFLSKVTPSKVKMYVIAKGLKTDKKEQHYGIDYSVETVPLQEYRQWEQANLNPNLAFPPPNKFIPKQLKVLADDPTAAPYQLLANHQGVFWFQQDTEFLQPKAKIDLDLLLNKVNSSPRQKLISLLYLRALRESINAWTYPAATAGMHLELDRFNGGIALTVSGYAEKIPAFMLELATKLKHITISADMFADLRNKLKRDLENLAFEDAYAQTLHKSSMLLNPIEIDYPLYKDMVASIKLSDVLNYAASLYTNVAFKGVGYGNLARNELKATLLQFFKTLGGKTLPVAERYERELLKLDQSYNYAFATEGNNHALTRIVPMGSSSAALDAQIRFIDAHVAANFFNRLRTEQQLGYVVHMGRFHNPKAFGMRMIVQSSDYLPAEINKRIDAFLATKLFADFDMDKLNSYRSSILQKLREEEKSIYERQARMYDELIFHKADFAYRTKLIKAVEEVKVRDVLVAWKKLQEAHTLTVTAFAKGTQVAWLQGDKRISDVKRFREKLNRY